MYRLLFVFFVCTVTDFSAENKASGISHFCKLCSQYAQNQTNRPARGPRQPHVNITVEMRRRKCYARDVPFVKSRGVWT